jgi:GTP cyclohydrolase I
MNAPIVPAGTMADVQSDADIRRLAIDRVGVGSLRYPLTFTDVGDEPQATVAICSAYVGLPAERKGTHMSRLIEWIDSARHGLSLATLPDSMRTLMQKLDATTAQVEFSFPWFVRKAAPVSGVESLMDYAVRLRADAGPNGSALTLSVVVPVTSLCPSSKAIADYGAHSQRSHVTLTVQPTSPFAISDLIAIAEEEASAELYGVLKRSDEKYVTERAYDHPKFVEDLVRSVASRLVGDTRFTRWTVEAENFESIHNHSAYACIESPGTS